MSENARTTLFALILTIAVLLLATQVRILGLAGTYQLAAGNKFYVVLDTRNGKVIRTDVDNPTSSNSVSALLADYQELSGDLNLSTDKYGLKVNLSSLDVNLSGKISVLNY